GSLRPFGAGPTPSSRAATSSLALVAGPSSRIGERLPRDGNELPIEARRLQSQLEHAEGGIIADHAVRGPGGIEREEAVPARAGDELDDALHQVQVAARVLRREAFVVVGMAVHDKIGHAHNYERFAPQDASGNLDLVKGIIELIAGTGGDSLFPFNAARAPNSVIGNDSTFGVLKLTLQPTSFYWQFIPIAGQTFTDSGTRACH